MSDEDENKTKLKMTVNQLEKLQTLVEAEGQQRIGGGNKKLVYDYIIDVNEDHLRVQAISDNDIAGLDIKFEDVEDIEETGQIVVQDAEKVGEIPKRFSTGDNDTLTITDNDKYLMFKRNEPQKRVKLKTTNPDAIDSQDEGLWSNIQYNDDEDFFITPSGAELKAKATIQSRYLQEVVDDAGYIGADDYPFKLTNGKFGVDAGEDNTGRIQSQIPVESTRGEAESKYRYGLGGIVQNNEGELDLYFADNEGLIIENDTDDFRARYVVMNVKSEN